MDRAWKTRSRGALSETGHPNQATSELTPLATPKLTPPNSINGTALTGLSTLCPRRRSSSNQVAVGKGWVTPATALADDRLPPSRCRPRDGCRIGNIAPFEFWVDGRATTRRIPSSREHRPFQCRAEPNSYGCRRHGAEMETSPHSIGNPSCSRWPFGRGRSASGTRAVATYQTTQHRPFQLGRVAAPSRATIFEEGPLPPDPPNPNPGAYDSPSSDDAPLVGPRQGRGATGQIEA